MPDQDSMVARGAAGFAARTQASRTKFIDDQLALGIARASVMRLGSFWEALDQLYGGHLLQPQAA